MTKLILKTTKTHLENTHNMAELLNHVQSL